MPILTAAASVTEGLTTALGSVASDMTGAITAVLPIAVPVMSGIAVIIVGIKLFKKMAK